jgi:hypothetical protein
MTRLNTVMCDFVTQEGEIQDLFGPWVSLVAVVVHTSRPLRNETDPVSADEAGDPALADRAVSHI